LNASASVPGTFTYTPPAGTRLDAGNGRTLSVTFTPADSTAYSAVSKNVQINVTRAPLVVTPNSATKLYGDPLPALTGSIMGVQSGDNITATFSTTATQTSPVGSYDITAALSDPASRLGNYIVTLNKGTLTVTKAPLTLTADDKSRPFGYNNPPLTGTIVGIKNGDAITANYSTSAIPMSDPGTYPIVPAPVDPSGKLPNYVVTVKNGTLTVEPPTITSAEGLLAEFVTSAGVAGALRSQLEAIQQAVDSDNASARDGALKAFSNSVSAQIGKSLTADQAAILIAAAGKLQAETTSEKARPPRSAQGSSDGSRQGSFRP